MTADSTPLKVAIVGAGGRMGQFAAQWLERDPSMQIMDRIHSDENLERVLGQSQAQVVLDLTRAGLGAAHARTILEAGKSPVIGTSGVDPAEDGGLDRLARSKGLGGLIVPNFSLGVCLQQAFAVLASRCLASVEIVEEHHERKKDRPSATALDTAARVEAALPKDAPPVPIHSLRVQGLHSNQSVVCTGPGEVLRIVHETYDLEAFGPGISLALRHVSGAVGVQRGLQACLGSNFLDV
ncbi:MAG: dihydrodipicolinate reductase C-terminal domain-containing protein [Planctomycetota bacterium]|nr:dihydrodipicolinate reductase C-terminal domain-containing protein [Planctomycetota bacterium]